MILNEKPEDVKQGSESPAKKTLNFYDILALEEYYNQELCQGNKIAHERRLPIKLSHLIFVITATVASGMLMRVGPLDSNNLQDPNESPKYVLFNAKQMGTSAKNLNSYIKLYGNIGPQVSVVSSDVNTRHYCVRREGVFFVEGKPTRVTKQYIYNDQRRNKGRMSMDIRPALAVIRPIAAYAHVMFNKTVVLGEPYNFDAFARFVRYKIYELDYPIREVDKLSLAESIISMLKSYFYRAQKLYSSNNNNYGRPSGGQYTRYIHRTHNGEFIKPKGIAKKIQKSCRKLGVKLGWKAVEKLIFTKHRDVCLSLIDREDQKKISIARYIDAFVRLIKASIKAAITSAVDVFRRQLPALKTMVGLVKNIGKAKSYEHLFKTTPPEFSLNTMDKNRLEKIERERDENSSGRRPQHVPP